MIDEAAEVRPLPVQGARPTLQDSLDLRSLIPNAQTVLEPIRYSQDVWRFVGYPLVNQSVTSLDFTGIPARWRHAVKDWILLRLDPSLASSGRSGLNARSVMAPAAAAEKPIALMSALAYVGCFAVSLTIIDRRGWTAMSSRDWELFAHDLRDQLPDASPQTLAGYARPLNSLWAFRDVIGIPGMFGGRPFDGRKLESVFKVPPRGLNIERPAPELCGPLLGLSLWILDHCAQDILTRLEQLAAAPDLSGASRSEQAEAVRRVVEDWEASGRPLPAVRRLSSGEPSVSWATFFKRAGVPPEDLRNKPRELVRMVERIREERGLSFAEDGFGLPIREVPCADGTNRPWIDGLPATRYGLGLDLWVTALAYACAFVVTIFTTIRDRELSALPHDCLHDGIYERGDLDVPVTRMRGYLVKNRKDPVSATWVVADDVARAVRTVQRLKELLRLPPVHHAQTGEEILFHPGLGEERAKDSLRLDKTYLRRFRATGDHLSARGAILPLPELPEYVAHRTIRVTGLEAYVDQAWGDALAAAQGHWSNRKVAEGYYGHLPNSVYIADPDSIEEARQITIAQTLIDTAAESAQNATAVTGAGIDRLHDVLDKSGAYELVNGPVTRRQLTTIAKANKNVFVGEFTICIHGSGGLCGNEEEADFRLCRPHVCRNSAMTLAQRARLELRRRFLSGKGGVFERAKRKIEADTPDIAREFADKEDSELRAIALSELPGRYADAARRETQE